MSQYINISAIRGIITAGLWRQVSNYYLEAVIEEEEGDILTAVTWLVTQGNGFNPVYQATMGGQQISLQREMERGGDKQSEWEKPNVCAVLRYICVRRIYAPIHMQNFNNATVRLSGRISRTL